MGRAAACSKAHGFRFRELKLGFGSTSPFGKGTFAGGSEHDITRPELRHHAADLRRFPSNIHSGPVGFHSPVQRLSTDGRQLNSHDDFVVLANWFFKVSDFQNLARTTFRVNGGFHLAEMLSLVLLRAL